MEVDEAVNAAQPVLFGGRYLVGPLLGRGGGAEVFRAHDQRLDRPVAVKIFPAGLAGPESSRQRREVSILAGLSHPGLVMVYDAGDEQGRAFFVMRLVEGRTLGDRLWEGSLPVTEAVGLGIALADALAYVHSRGIMHRDVKPGNVLLDRHDHPHLSDFGVAALVDSTQITGTGTVVGTAAYLAPEQVRGRPVGPSVDVYALGLVLLECLTGVREYRGSAMEAALARLHRAPTIPEALPPAVAALLRQMTADDPDGRPTASEVVQRLRAIEPARSGSVTHTTTGPMTPVATTRPTPVTAVPGWSHRLSRIPPPRRLRSILLVAALLVAVGSVLAIPALSDSRTANAPPVEASPPSTPPVSSQTVATPAQVAVQSPASSVDEQPAEPALLIAPAPVVPGVALGATAVVPQGGPAKDQKPGRR